MENSQRRTYSTKTLRRQDEVLYNLKNDVGFENVEYMGTIPIQYAFISIL